MSNVVANRELFKTWEIVSFTNLVVGAAIAALVWNYGLDEAGASMILRLTGRISFPLFVMIALASSLQRLAPSYLSRWLMANRKYIGLTFAVIYLYHFFGIALLLWSTGSPGIEGLEFALSLICYGFLVIMTVTSFNAIRTRMSKWIWNAIHGTGMLFFWYFFLAEFIHLAEDVSPVFYGALASIAAMIPIIKLVALSKPEKPLQTL